MDKTENFVIDYKKADFSSDYRLFYKKKYKKSLRQLLGGLTLSIIVFFLIKTFADWKIIESISVGIIVLISNFVFFKIYDILTIDKKLKKVISPIYLGKTNLIFGSTFIELNQYGRKRIIFISQLIKCIIISDIIFFIEKSNKYLPVKINKSEMTDNSFQELVKKLKVSGIKIEK